MHALFNRFEAIGGSSIVQTQSTSAHAGSEPGGPNNPFAAIWTRKPQNRPVNWKKGSCQQTKRLYQIRPKNI